MIPIEPLDPQPRDELSIYFTYGAVGGSGALLVDDENGGFQLVSMPEGVEKWELNTDRVIVQLGKDGRWWWFRIVS